MALDQSLPGFSECAGIQAFHPAAHLIEIRLRLRLIERMEQET